MNNQKRFALNKAESLFRFVPAPPIFDFLFLNRQKKLLDKPIFLLFQLTRFVVVSF